MKNKLKLFGIYLPVFLVLTLSAVVLRTVALFVQFDFDTGYFSENILIKIADYMTVVLSVFLFTYIFAARKDIRLIPDFSSARTYVPTGLVSAALVFVAISLFAPKGGYGSLILAFVGYITAILAILSAVSFIVMPLAENHLNSRRVYLGLATVLFLSFYAAYLYFDQALPINSPNKMLDEMAYLFAAVFFLYEVRLSMKREAWRPYIAFGFIAAAIAAYSAIPALILYVIGGKTVSNSVYEIALTLALFVFILSRVLLTGELIEDKRSPIAAAFIENAEKREQELHPEPQPVVEITGESLVDDEDESQITIDDVAEAEEEDEISVEIIIEDEPVSTEEEE